MPTVFVVSRDWTLRTAVRAELREHGVEALGLETADDVGRQLGRGIVPAVVVIDGAELEHDLPRQEIANLARQVTVLVVDSRVTPAPQIPQAERLERPIGIGDIVSRVLARLTESAG